LRKPKPCVEAQIIFRIPQEDGTQKRYVLPLNEARSLYRIMRNLNLGPTQWADEPQEEPTS
jgi:hypothetical protein